MRQQYLCDLPNSMPTSTGNTNQNPLSTISITTILNKTSQHSHKLWRSWSLHTAYAGWNWQWSKRTIFWQKFAYSRNSLRSSINGGWWNETDQNWQHMKVTKLVQENGFFTSFRRELYPSNGIVKVRATCVNWISVANKIKAFCIVFLFADVLYSYQFLGIGWTSEFWPKWSN